jgi:hypothetical protein
LAVAGLSDTPESGGTPFLSSRCGLARPDADTPLADGRLSAWISVDNPGSHGRRGVHFHEHHIIGMEQLNNLLEMVSAALRDLCIRNATKMRAAPFAFEQKTAGE